MDIARISLIKGKQMTHHEVIRKTTDLRHITDFIGGSCDLLEYFSGRHRSHLDRAWSVRVKLWSGWSYRIRSDRSGKWYVPVRKLPKAVVSIYRAISFRNILKVNLRDGVWWWDDDLLNRWGWQDGIIFSAWLSKMNNETFRNRIENHISLQS